MTVSAPAKTRAPLIGATIDNLWALREQKKKAEEAVREIEVKIKEAEETLTERLEAEGMEKATGTKATISIGTSVVADVQDWDEFWKYIIKNKYTHLLQRRVSEPAYRELLDAGKKVPGVLPFTKKKLNFRSL